MTRRRFLKVFVPCLVLVAGAALLAAGAPGCNKRSNRTTIAVIPKGTTHEFWKSVHAGANKAAKELDVDVIWKGPLKEDDRDSQINTVEDFITRGVSGIVLAPLDDTALQGPVANAGRAGIPVVIIDSGLKGGDYVSFIATNNYEGGRLAGEHLAELLGNKGRILLLRYQVGSASTTEREKGFLDAIAKHPDLKVVSENQYAGATPESAVQASENVLAPLKGDQPGTLQVDGIFCPNESSTFGMLQVLRSLGAAGKVKFMGFDASSKLTDALRDGQIDGLIVQDPVNMAYLGVKTMVQKLRGQPVEKRVDMAPTLVTKQNMEDPKIKPLLQPDLAKWLDEK